MIKVLALSLLLLSIPLSLGTELVLTCHPKTTERLQLPGFNQEVININGHKLYLIEHHGKFSVWKSSNALRP